MCINVGTMCISHCCANGQCTCFGTTVTQAAWEDEHVVCLSGSRWRVQQMVNGAWPLIRPWPLNRPWPVVIPWGQPSVGPQSGVRRAFPHGTLRPLAGVAAAEVAGSAGGAPGGSGEASVSRAFPQLVPGEREAGGAVAVGSWSVHLPSVIWTMSVSRVSRVINTTAQFVTFRCRLISYVICFVLFVLWSVILVLNEYVC